MYFDVDESGPEHYDERRSHKARTTVTILCYWASYQYLVLIFILPDTCTLTTY
jgi:hypothetical protein